MGARGAWGAEKNSKTTLSTRLLTFAARASLRLNSYTDLVLLELKVPEGGGGGWEWVQTFYPVS